MQRVDPGDAAAVPGFYALEASALLWVRGLAWTRARVVVVAFGFAVATVATRFPMRGRYLFNWDALQFALGIQRFDLATHRPHPPGYIGYIYLGRLLTHLTGATIETVLTAVSIAGEAATIAGLYLVARRLFGEFAGLAAALLLLSSPLYWMYGETALTYGLEPALALLGFWLLYRASRQSGRRLVLAAAVIGLEGAIRESSEVFLLPALATVALVALRRGGPASRRTVALAAAAVLGATALWALPLVALSGGLPAYLRVSAELGARVTANSAIWRAGLAGLNLDTSAVLNGLLMSLGIFLPLLLAAGLLRLAEGRALRPPPDRGAVALVALCLAPALVTYLLIHIGQLAYVLFGVPLLLLFAGPVLTRLATLTLRRGELARGRLRATALGVCVVANLAVFFVPANSLAGQVRARDLHVAAVTTAVRWFDPSTTVLLTDPEGPSSYRTAMYYLPEYDVVAVGRDSHGRAGEMFSNRVGAPEYDLARFVHAGPLHLPAGDLAVILDDAVLRSLGDPQWLETSTYGPGAADRMYFAHLAPADPPLNHGDLIYLRGSDCPCRGELRGRPMTRRGSPA
jgi:hypothetical protein